MATPVLIDLSNYDTLLVQSTQGRAGTPDGNIFFDVANGLIELITAEELATVDLGSGAEANPLTNALGIKMEALYAFERQERRVDETLRQYDQYFKGTFKYGGAYEMVNGRKFASGDRQKVRGSGWIERAIGGAIGRIYFGVRSLGDIDSGSQPYYHLSANNAPTDFNRQGPIDEAVQVYGDNAVDPTTTTFNTRTYLSMKVRTFGNTYDEKLLEDSGIVEMDGYAVGFALGESAHPTSGSYDLADVYGGSQIAPWTGMTLEKLATPQVETGFNESDGSFSWVLNNTAGGTLNQCVAFLDALAQTDDDIDSGFETVTQGQRYSTWYSYNAAGKVVTRSGRGDGLGLFIENLPEADRQSIVFTDDSAATKTFPFNVQVDIAVGADAVLDVLAWYHLFFLDGPGANDFNTANALTVEDKDGVEVKGNVSTDAVGSTVSFSFDYDGDTIGGTAGTDKDIVIQVEGDGGVTAAKTVFTLTRTATIPVSCIPAVETNV